MEINRSLKERIEEINKHLSNGLKGFAEERFSELLFVFERVDNESLDQNIVKTISRLKGKIDVSSVKEKVKELGKKERKLIKIDDFSHVCDLMKSQRFDEAFKKFYEREK